MTELVRDHVGLREVTGRAEAPRQLVEEAEIEVDLPVPRTVEGTGRRLGEAARRLDRIAEQHETRPLVSRSEPFRPHVLPIFRDAADEVDAPFFDGRTVDLSGGADARRPRAGAE